METYAVYTCNEYSVDAETELSARDVVRHIYRSGGADYRLEPKMITNRYDDGDGELPDIQDTTSSDDQVFEVWFKNNGSHPWHKSQRIAIGKDENEAEEAFLQESFDGTMWKDAYWTVLTTEQYLAGQKVQL